MGQSRLVDLLIALSLCLLLLAAFWLIGPAGRVLAGGDLFTYFYPYWAEASRALRAGRLPLWNPYLFMGVPFLANSQVGTFYPPNWPLWLLLPSHRALHWSIVLHLGLTAVGAYLFTRSSLRLGRLGAWTTGAVWALGGYLGAQVEHINQLQALSWFPWLLLFYDRTVGAQGSSSADSPLRPLRSLRSNLAWLGLLAAGVGMVLLAGHTQSAFIVLVGLAVYGVGPAVWEGVRRQGWQPVAQRTAVWALAAGIGGALAAVQLLPTLQLTGLSVRAGGLPFKERVSFSLSPVYLARALLPGYVRPVEPENIEYIATVGVTGLLLAFRGWQRGDRRRLRGIAFLSITGLFLALGLYNPVYLLLARFVPGFAHFRAPARWLALWAFGVAALAGAGVEHRRDAEDTRLATEPRRAQRFSVFSRFLCVLCASVVFFVWGALGGQVVLVTVGAWVATALLAVAALRWRKRALLVVLLVAELFVSARTLPRARATAPQAYTSLRPAVAHLLVANEGRTPPDRFLSLSALIFDPGDLPELRLIYGDQLSPDALYDLIVAAKHREVLSPNLPLAFRVPAVDGYDGGVLPLARFLALQRAFLPEDTVSLDGRLRENLTQVPDGRWLSLFDVRYVITDKVGDAWVDDVFYDLQFGADLTGGESASVAYVPPFEATAVGLIGYVEGADLPERTPVGEAVVGFADGTTRTFPLRVGVEVAPAPPEGLPRTAARLRWEGAAVPTAVSVRATLPSGRLIVRGVSLIDERTGSFQSLVLSDRGRFRLVHSGDVKVYENLEVLPRAFVAFRAQVVEDEAAALDRMRSPAFDPAAEVVVERGPISLSSADPPQPAQVVAYAPERVEVEVDLATPGYLVLTDANYPGWRAWVDGEPAEVMTADLLFRAVYLEPGRHRVLFAFRPTLVRAGAGVSLVALLGLGWLVVRGWNRPERPGRPGRRTAPRTP
ncbi:MAG TPA: hypothetical protein ENK08_00595 [Chloroflexi bacterium]|nr:hypothetical protein [Chloroflexota bacterium]